MLKIFKSILEGEVEISGSKNAFFPAIGAGIALGAKEIKIKNIPKVRDVFVMLEIIKNLGAVYSIGEREVVIYTDKLKPGYPDKELFSKIRGGIVLLGAFLSRFKEAKIPFPGGCNIGKRPIDQHIKSALSLGFSVEETSEGIKAYGEIKNHRISFDIKTVTGTENAILMSIATDQEIEIRNYAKEPEVQELIKYLEKYGVEFHAEDDTLFINPKKKENTDEVEFELIPDRIEAGTFLIATAATGGKLKVKNVIPSHLGKVIEKLKEAGAKLKTEGNEVEIEGEEKYNALHIVSDSFPEFPTDLQPQITVMLLKADKPSVIEERVFPERINHVYELQKMGANVKITGNRIIVFPGKIRGEVVEARDLRNAAAMIIAGLIAEDKPTIVKNFEIIERGYERFFEKIQRLGAKFYIEIRDKVINNIQSHNAYNAVEEYIR